jgi:hypothetical protein
MNSGSHAKLKILRDHFCHSLFFRCWYGIGKVYTHFVFKKSKEVPLADPAVRRTGDRRPLPIFFSYFFSAEIRKKNFY